MEYEFIQDPSNGSACARFSLEHENLGPWLEIELANNTEKLTEILSAIACVGSGEKHEVTIVGHEFSVTMDKNDVTVQSNSSLNGFDSNEEMSILAELNASEQHAHSVCGLEDFHQLLLSWSKFVH